MCGFAGWWSVGGRQEVELQEVGRRMAGSLAHRGPDDSGVWVDAPGGVMLAHRRLSILDLSDAGHQPMASHDGRYQLVYNGEIYNFAQLRRELVDGGCSFHGHSDTEVLVEAIAAWGLANTLTRINGMFAFAVWDRTERALTLVRDRLGIKPLYYGWVGQELVFASELNALRHHPQFSPRIDRRAVALLLEHGYIPAPCTIWRDVRKLPPGSVLNIPECDKVPDRSATPTRYWDVQEVARRASVAPFAGSCEEAIDVLHELLRDAVRSRLVADVPLGAFLSGGIDSSLVVALMQQVADRPVRAFTMGFEPAEFNEAPWAEPIASRLGVEHTVHYVSAQEALNVVPRLPEIYDEPFADSSQIPTYLVSQLARRHVTVALSGDGGDELFCGYPRYFHLEGIWRKIGWLPTPLRQGVAGPLIGGLRRLLRRRPRGEPGVWQQIVSCRDAQQLYLLLNRHWHAPQGLVMGVEETTCAFDPMQRWVSRPSLREQMMGWDMTTYLPDDILTKVDRASMAVGLEVRVPLLDYRVVELAWSFPASWRTRDGQGKWPLRQLLQRYLPRELFERPKAGFGVPLAQWLRGELRDWAAALLDPVRLEQQGLLRSEPIGRKWQEHQAGEHDWQYLLWDVLMLQAWLETSDTPPPAAG